MSKYNKKKEPVRPTEVNDMGEKAFKLSAKEELVSTTLTTFVQSSYYEKENEIVNRIKSAASKTDPLFVAKLAIYLRQEANMRSSSHLLAGELSGVNAEWKSRFFRKILVRPDDMSEILAYYKATKNKGGEKLLLPNAIKKAFKQKLESMDAYLIDKYKMKGKDFNLVDMFNLFHPKPTSKNAEAYRRLINGESLDGLYASKILEKEMSKAGQTAKVTEAKVEDLKEEAIEAVLANLKGMPIFNLLRNLRNILLIAPGSVKEACRQLTIEDKVLKSRLLPFRFASAYGEISKLTGKEEKSSIKFEKDASTDFNANKKMILDALERALEISCKNIPVLDGNVAVLIDHSGSVRGDGGGSGTVSAFSKTTTATIGNLFASMLVYKQDNVYVGLFGDKLIQYPVDRSKGMLAFQKASYDKGAQCGGGTEAGIYHFLELCVKEKKKIDNLVVFSDCVIGSGGSTSWYGHGGSERSAGFQELFKKFRAINPLCNTISVNIKDTKGTSVFDKSMRVLQVAGWSDKIFDHIQSNCVGYKELIAEIEAIEI